MASPPPEQSDIRWKQRFDNLQRAYEFTFELSWKTLKDFLAYNGIDAKLPRDVLKQAFATGLIRDGQLWIDMLKERNLMAHTYDDAREIVQLLQAGQVADVTHMESLHYAPLREHIERVSIPFP